MSRGLPEYNQLMRFTINDVCNWLAENRFGEFVKMFRQYGIDGNRFVTLEDLDLTRMQCPMNKRRDLLKLIKDIQKPIDSRVKGIVQQPLPATPTRDYNASHHRAPAPIPNQSPQNGLSANDDEGSGPEDDYEWGSDFSDVSSDEDLEDYENNAAVDVPRPPLQQPDQDSDSAGSYEEPDPQSAPPPISQRRGVAQVPPTNSPRPPVPASRRLVPLISPEEDNQPVYEETNDDEDQLVYEDPDDQPAVVPEPVKRPGRRQLPPPEPDTIQRKVPLSLRNSEPEVPAPPPPRGRNTPKGNKNREPSDTAPAPPPPRGGRKPQPPPEPEEQQEVYEDPDASQPTQPPAFSTGRKASNVPPPQDDFPQDVYEDPDAPQPEPYRQKGSAGQLKTKPKSNLTQSQNGPPAPPPSRSKMKLPPTPKETQQKVPRHVKKPPPPEEEPQLEYEVPEDLLKGEMPVDDYMEMQATQEEKKHIEKKSRVQVFPTNGETKTHTLPPRPGGKKKSLPMEQPEVPPPQPKHTEERKKHKHGHRPLPQPTDSGVPLEEQSWYFGDIERQDADKKLLDVGTNGCYLIRRSKKGGETKPYTLAIIYSGQVFNLNIRKKANSKFALGNPKTDEQEFTDLPDLVSFFNSHRLILAKGQTRLKKPCPK